jgi:hypothetical protein
MKHSGLTPLGPSAPGTPFPWERAWAVLCVVRDEISNRVHQQHRPTSPLVSQCARFGCRPIARTRVLRAHDGIELRQGAFEDAVVSSPRTALREALAVQTDRRRSYYDDSYEGAMWP